MHGIIISPMIYNVKRIYICLSDIFKLFQDFFKRNSGNHSSPHKFTHNPTFYDKTPHKEGKMKRVTKVGGNYGPGDAIPNKICLLLLGERSQQNASTHKKALAQIRSRALPTVFYLALFIKIQPSYGLCKRAERNFIF